MRSIAIVPPRHCKHGCRGGGGEETQGACSWQKLTHSKVSYSLKHMCLNVNSVSTFRRSKSADPSAPEATVSAVQAVLNAKQSRLVELSSKVQSLEAQISTNATSLLSWETRAREAERELISATNSLASSNREREEAKLSLQSLRTRLEKGEEASRGGLITCSKLT